VVVVVVVVVSAVAAAGLGAGADCRMTGRLGLTEVVVGRGLEVVVLAAMRGRGLRKLKLDPFSELKPVSMIALETDEDGLGELNRTL